MASSTAWAKAASPAIASVISARVAPANSAAIVKLPRCETQNKKAPLLRDALSDIRHVMRLHKAGSEAKGRS